MADNLKQIESFDDVRDIDATVDLTRVLRNMAEAGADPEEPTISYLGVRDATKASVPRGGREMFAAASERRGYDLGTPIGLGGFGEVLEAVQHPLGRTVAIKRIREEHAAAAAAGDTERSSMLSNSFVQEALVTANLEHPNIVPVYDLTPGGPAGIPMMAMKRLRGQSWHRMIASDRKTLSRDEFLGRHLRVLIEVGQAVAFAHSRGVAHRDIKPGQVMVGEFGEVVLMDWGLGMVFDDQAFGAKAMEAFAGNAPTVDNAPNPAGTISFMAPEQTFSHARELGPWTDIYLLGATLYQILTGKGPHDARDARTSFERAQKSVVAPPAGMADSAGDLPGELSAVCLKAMSADRANRHGTVAAFNADLEGYLEGVGRRRNSASLTDGVRTRMAEAAGDYREYSHLLSQLGSAETLWAGNPDTPALRASVLAAFVEDAMANQDLTLAQLHLGMMPEGEDRTRLESRVNTFIRDYRAERRRLRRQPIVAWTVATLLAVALGVALAFSLVRLNRVSGDLKAAQKALRP